MLRSLRKIGIVAGLSGLLATSSCTEDIGGSSWDMDVLAPLVSAKLTMADLLTDSLIEADAEGRLRLRFETDLIGLQIDSIVRIPDTTIIDTISFTIPITDLPPGSDFLPFLGRTRYQLGGVALTNVRLRQGKLKVKLRSVLPTPVEFTYEMPLAHLWGVPFIFTSRIEAGSAGNPAETEFEFDLRHYDLDLRSSSLQSYNTLESRYTLRTAADGITVSIPAGQEFFFLEYSFVDIVPDYGRGYFGQQSEEVDELLDDIDVLSRITDGQLLLDSVTIDLMVINGVGADAMFRLNSLSSINTRTGNTVNLAHPIVQSNQPLSRAVDVNGSAAGVQASTLNFRLDNSNSNVKAVLENLPDKLGFNFKFDINPLGNVSSGNDFFYYDRPFEARMAVNVPLRASIQNLTLVDTVAWNLEGNAAIESINSGMFTLVAKNGFPLEGMAELILLDSNMQRFDTLVAPSVIACPALDSELKVIAPLESRISIPLPARTAERLHMARFVRITVRFDSPFQPQLIDLYSHYAIDLKVIGNLSINFNPSGN